MPIRVQCVFGEDNKMHLESLLLPSLARQGEVVDLHLLNYEPGSLVTIQKPTDWAGEFIVKFTSPGKPKGFAENHNRLFFDEPVDDMFIIINPDCIAEPNLIDELLHAYRTEERIGIVEARQWPFEQLKEYDAKTKNTPWASGACCLIDSRFYKEVGGMDPSFFMYVEDVDLSWRAWLSGRRVLYQRTAVVKHFTSGFFSLEFEYSTEQLFCLRNHIWLAYNYFGEMGKASAIRQISMILPTHVVERVIWDYNKTFGSYKRSPKMQSHPMIKILGPNLYHEVSKR